MIALARQPQTHPVPDEFKESLLGLVQECWICKKLLAKYGGDSGLIQNFHHCIPRAYGGVDGPIVSLCAGHHDMLHVVALRLISGKPYADLISSLSCQEQENVLYLASRIKLAALYSKDDPNKKTAFGISLSNGLNKQLSDIAKFKNLSKENVMRKLIQEAHNHLFPKRK